MSPLSSVAFYDAISFLIPDLWLFHTSSNSAMPLGILQFNYSDMATYSSILVWKIPWTEEPGGL